MKKSELLIITAQASDALIGEKKGRKILLNSQADNVQLQPSASFNVIV